MSGPVGNHSHSQSIKKSKVQIPGLDPIQFKSCDFSNEAAAWHLIIIRMRSFEEKCSKPNLSIIGCGE